MSWRRDRIISSRAKAARTSTSELKGELLKWICLRHATNGLLNRKLLRDRAIELATASGVIGFKCSEAWLTMFLKKHGFSPSLTNCIGPTFTDYRIWIDFLRSLITQYRHKDLFNVDELVMYSDFLPSRRSATSLSSKNDEKSRVSSQTKRIGILLCCNSSGTEKLEPMISNPYILEKSRGINRRYQVSCINDEAFNVWLERLNARVSKSRRSILLLLSRERIRSLKNVQRLSNVKLVFLPRDFPTQLRPLRGDIFHYVKMTYRRRYAQFIRSRDELGETAREWNTRDNVLEAWMSVPRELIVSSFQRTKFREDQSFLKIQCPEWDSRATGMSFRRFVTFDDRLSEVADRGYDQEIRFVSSNSGENRYNLRRMNRCDTVDIDDGPEIKTSKKKSQKVRKAKDTRNNRRTSRGDRGDVQDLTLNDQEIGVGSSIQIDRLKKIGEIEQRHFQLPDIERIDKGPDTSNAPETNLESPTVKEFHGSTTKIKDAIEVTNRTTLPRNKSDNFPGEASAAAAAVDAEPSDRGSNDFTRNAIQDVNSPTATLELDDDEKIPDRELELRIVKAVDTCDKINDSHSGDHLRSSKRSRTLMGGDNTNLKDDDEPALKRARSDGNWSKRYEKIFVFGPEVIIEDPNDVQSTSTNDVPSTSTNVDRQINE